MAAVCSIGFAVALNLTPIFNKDFWIQLKIGDLIREGGIPGTVLFSFTEAGDRPFLAYEWLSSLVWSHLFGIGGYEGMIVVKCLLGLLILGLSVCLSFQVNRNWVASLALGCVCVLGVNIRSFLRPELLAFCLGLVNLNLLQAFRRTGRVGWLVGLLPTSVFWANAHGSFLMNLVLPLFFIVGGLVDAWWSGVVEGRQRRMAAQLAVAWVLMVAASCSNPYGLQLFAHVVELSRSEFIRQHIIEWRSSFYPLFWDQRFFAVYLLLSAGAFIAVGIGIRRLTPSLVALVLGSWLLTVDVVRHIPWFVIFSCYALAHLFVGRAARGAGWLSCLALAGTLVVFLYGNVRGVRPGFENMAPLQPAVLEFMRAMHLSGNVFNSYSYGDQLAYHFFPEVRIAIDSRVDAYGAEAYLKFRRLSGRNAELLGEPQELLDFLREYDVRAIVTRPREYTSWVHKGHADALSGEGWAEVYRDARTVILTRP